ncbi:MAG: MarR family transcriptional regulator [Nitrospinae bacterium]|nr:MarR family transcriptional regulator [Nitrospinota bacterium]
MKLESVHKCPVGFHINRTANLLRNSFNSFLKPYGIAGEQFTLLKILNENPAITQTEISEYLYKNKTTITRMMDVLEKKGYITKVRQNNDRRSFRISVTKSGKSLISELSGIFDPKIERLNNVFSEEEMASFLKVIDKFQEFLFKEAK